MYIKLTESVTSHHSSGMWHWIVCKFLLDFKQRLVTSALGSSNTRALLGTLELEDEDITIPSKRREPLTHISKHLRRLATPQGVPWKILRYVPFSTFQVRYSSCLSQYLTNFMHKICFTISFISCLYMFRALCAHHQVVKIVLHSLWYHHTYRWPSRARDDTRGCVMQFWPPDAEHMCSKHVEAWNKTYCETNFVHQVG